MSDTPDLSKIIGLIMQNPSLIEQIAHLAKERGDSVQEVQTNDDQLSQAAAEAKNDTEPTSSSAFTDSPSRHRHELLSALKPYLSENRRAAIDSMMSISDVMAMMRKQ